MFFPFVFIGTIYVFYHIYIIDPLSGGRMPTTYESIIHCLAFIAFFVMLVFIESEANWEFERFQLNADGIHLKSFFGTRTINWNRIEKAKIYKVLWGQNNDGPQFILAFLDWEKRPKRLDDTEMYFKRKYVVMIRATEENIREFESFWGKPLDIGRQKGSQYTGC